MTQYRPFGYPILPIVQFPIFLNATADDMPANTEKAKVFHHLEVCFQVLATTTEPVANVIDGNVQLYVHSHIPDNFQGVAEMVCQNHQESTLLQIYIPKKTNSNKLFGLKQRGTSKILLSKT